MTHACQMSNVVIGKVKSRLILLHYSILFICVTDQLLLLIRVRCKMIASLVKITKS